MVTVYAFATIQDAQDGKTVYRVTVHSLGALRRERQTARKEGLFTLLFDENGKMLEGHKPWTIAEEILENISVAEWLETCVLTSNDSRLKYLFRA